MNVNGLSDGGWKSSDLRRWLSDSFYGELPEDLQSAIVSVEKQTNNYGKTNDSAAVSATSDKLWLPSIAELCGKITWEVDQPVKRILDLEGSQYKLFKDANVFDDGANAILARSAVSGAPAEWWLRTTRSHVKKDPDFYFVDATGNPHNFGKEGTDPSSFKDVIPGFCI